MSKNGMTVSEANLDNSEVTFQGFPWRTFNDYSRDFVFDNLTNSFLLVYTALRLRYVMENAHSLSEARSIWQHTKNTAAFNFLIGSSSDASNGNAAAMALETMENFTAYFYDNSPVEANATWQWPNTSIPENIGFPMRDAVEIESRIASICYAITREFMERYGLEVYGVA